MLGLSTQSACLAWNTIAYRS